jgi:hypothetical protein
MIIIILQRQGGGDVFRLFYNEGGVSDRSPDDKSFNSATVSRLESAGLPASRLRKYDYWNNSLSDR